MIYSLPSKSYYSHIYIYCKYKIEKKNFPCEYFNNNNNNNNNMTTNMTKTKHCSICKNTGHNKRTCPNLDYTRVVDATAVPVCSVCLDQFGDKACCKLACGHNFHTKCIFTWVQKNNNCPMCRANIPELAHEEGPNMLLPPYGFLELVLNMTEDTLRENPPPNVGEITNRVFAMATITNLESVLNGLSRAQYLIYCERARSAEIQMNNDAPDLHNGAATL